MSNTKLNPEQIVSTRLSELGYRHSRIPKPEQRLGKTPDFRIFDRGGRPFGYVEVKTITGGNDRGGLSEDQGAQRLADRIVTASRQLNAPTDSHLRCRILAIVNQDDQLDVYDMIGLLRNRMIHFPDYPVAPPLCANRYRRLQTAFARIDRFLWIDDGFDTTYLICRNAARVDVLGRTTD